MVGHSSEADAQALGSIPIRSFTADEIRCNRGSARSSARKRAQEEIESAPVRRRGGTAEASTTSSEVVRREFADANLGGKLLDDVPDQLFRNSFAPDISGAAHAPKETTGVDSSRRCPVIHKAMHPIRNGNGSNVTTFAAQVYDLPNALRAAGDGQQSTPRARGAEVRRRAAAQEPPDPVCPSPARSLAPAKELAPARRSTSCRALLPVSLRP